MKYSADNVFEGIPARAEEPELIRGFFQSHDLSPHTRRAMIGDLRMFARWFVDANREPFDSRRVTTSDIASFRDFLRREEEQAVASVNRRLCSVRKYVGFLVDQRHLTSNPAKGVKELRRQQLAPKGLERSQVRKLLREVELRNDIRASAIFTTFLFTGCRVSDLIQLEMGDLIISERSGSATFRFGKGGKQRSVPLPLPARRAMQAYLEIRPPVDCPNVFMGERGRLTDRGVRNLCDKFSVISGIRLHPHLLRHTYAHQFLRDNGNDLVALAQLLGHENIQTTARYSQRTAEALGEAADRLSY